MLLLREAFPEHPLVIQFIALTTVDNHTWHPPINHLAPGAQGAISDSAAHWLSKGQEVTGTWERLSKHVLKEWMSRWSTASTLCSSRSPWVDWSSLKILSLPGPTKDASLQDGKTSGQTDSTHQPRELQPMSKESTGGWDKGARVDPRQSVSDTSEGVGPGLPCREGISMWN